MSEVGETHQAFTRGSHIRASLPVVRSANQTKDRSLGLLHLQYGEETRQVRMPNEITSEDTVRALFVSAFPQHLTMEMLESPSVAVYIRDDTRNVYHELSDVRSVTDHSFLKIYHKDPGQVFNHGSRPSNGDVRVQPFARDAPHFLRQQSLPLPPRAQGYARQLSSPTTSPTRIPFGPRGSTLPAFSRDRVPGTPPVSVGPPCPSAILERRDVKPDDESSAVLADVVDHPSPHHQRPAATLYPSPGAGVDTVAHPSLHRQRSRRYADGQLPTLGSRTPPASPHKAGGDTRLLDVHRPHQVVALERATLGRQSLRREGSLEGLAKARSSMVPPLTTADLAMQTAGDPQTSRDRMKAMEEQIASLTGLVQHALTFGPAPGTAKEAGSEKSPNVTSPGSSVDSGGGSPIPLVSSRVPLGDDHITHTCPSYLRANLLNFSSSVSDLRQQLQEMRQLQLQNQESLKVMLIRAKQEICHKVAALAMSSDDPVQQQRMIVEEERHKYLDVEENVLLQLGELEQYVVELKQADAPGTAQRTCTLRDVDDGVVRLRRVGEGLTALKGEFPALQAKMRVVLRVEVEAVRFLKEEPHKLDTMLKRVKSLTEELSHLKRHANEDRPEAVENGVAEPVLTEHVAMATNPESVVAQEHLTLSATSQKLLPTAMNQEPVVIMKNLQGPVPKGSQKVSPDVMDQEPPPAEDQQLPVEVTSQETSPTLMADESPLPATEPSKVKSQRPSLPLVAQKSPQPIPTLEHLPPVTAQQSQPSPTEPQGSFIHSEVVPTSPVVIHHACSSPIQVQRSQHSSALSRLPSPPPTPPHSQDGLAASLPGPQSQDSGAGLQKRGPHSNHNGSADQPPGGRNMAKNRAMSIEAAQREWEEYQRMPDFDRILQEAQATMMMSIPNLEITDPIQEKTCTVPSATSPAEESTPLEPKAGKQRKSSSSEGPPTPTKSPPPPPPRRTHPPGSGLTTARSGEVIYNTRKESVTTQEGLEETTPLLHPKPSKPLPQPLTPPPIVASAIKDEENEEDRIMAELQVFQKCTVKDVGATNVSETPVRDPGSKDPVSLEEKAIYCVTAQVPPPERQAVPAAHEPKDQRVGAASSPQVHSVNAYRTSSGHVATAAPPGRPGVKHWSSPIKSECEVQAMSIDSMAKTSWVCQDPNLDQPAQRGVVAEVVPAQKGADKQQVSSVVQKDAQKAGEVVVLEKSIGVSIMSQVANSAAVEDQTQTLVSRLTTTHKGVQVTEGVQTSPYLPSEESTPTTDNIAFMITDTQVQALSCGEYEKIVSTEGDNVRTIKVDESREMMAQAESGLDKKPVIIIFNEPMDIRAAYNRLSTIFECEEELERVSTEKGNEEMTDEKSVKTRILQVTSAVDKGGGGTRNYRIPNNVNNHNSSWESSVSAEGADTKSTVDSKQDVKKKVKLKFPKKKLTALSKAIRTGSRTGKKTLQVVVYEDEEESNGTIRQLKEAQRFEISRSTSEADSVTTTSTSTRETTEELQWTSRFNHKIDEMNQNTSVGLGETMKQLESSVSGPSPKPIRGLAAEQDTSLVQSMDPVAKDTTEGPASPDRAVPPVCNAARPPQKRPKPQLLPRPAVIPRSATLNQQTQNVSTTSATSWTPSTTPAKTRMKQVIMEKAGKQQKLQEAQSQFRQANGSAKKAGGDVKALPALPASKIPAFCPSASESSPLSTLCSDVTNSSSAPSSANSSVPPLQAHWPISFNSPSPNPNDPLTLLSPSFSSQGLIGQPPSFLSPVFPPPLGQGGRRIRTIHTPFTSCKLQRDPANPH